LIIFKSVSNIIYFFLCDKKINVPAPRPSKCSSPNCRSYWSSNANGRRRGSNRETLRQGEAEVEVDVEGEIFGECVASVVVVVVVVVVVSHGK